MAVSAEISYWIDGLEREILLDPVQEEQLPPLKFKQDVLCLKICFDEIVAALLLLASQTVSLEEASEKLENLSQLAQTLQSDSSLSFEQCIDRFLQETRNFGASSREKETRRTNQLDLKEDEEPKAALEDISFEDYWNHSLHEGEAKTGDCQSDTRTEELVEKSDDFNLKPRARNLLKSLFEAWKRHREALLEQIEKKLIPTHRAQTRIANLFWGKEVVCCSAARRCGGQN